MRYRTHHDKADFLYSNPVVYACLWEVEQKEEYMGVARNKNIFSIMQVSARMLVSLKELIHKFYPQILMDFLDKRAENFCPSGVDRCECVLAPGL